MKKYLKITCVLIVILSLLFLIPSIVNADETFKYDFSEDWINKGDANVANVAENITGSIVTVIRVVGTGISIIMLSYVAIKYMSAAPSEKAEFKKSATAYIVGAIVLFGTTQILAIIADFATSSTEIKTSYVETVDIDTMYLG